MEEKQKPEKTEKKSGFSMYDFYSLLHDLVYLLSGLILIFVFCVRLVAVSGQSMMPTLHNKDYLVLQSSTFMGKLKYGDIVVTRGVRYEDGELQMFEGGEPIVKRVIATEGQKVEIYQAEDQQIHVFVDGKMLDEPYIQEEMRPYYFLDDQDGDPNRFSTTVSDGCIFVMGDNRNNSADSRHPEIGEIKTEQVLGKVLLIALPAREPDGRRDFSRFGTVH